MAVPLQTEPTVEPGRPIRLFDGLIVNGSDGGDGYTYDVEPDGQRFLLIEEETAADDSTNPLAGLDRLEVVLNWFEELRRLVPVN